MGTVKVSLRHQNYEEIHGSDCTCCARVVGIYAGGNKGFMRGTFVASYVVRTRQGSVVAHDMCSIRYVYVRWELLQPMKALYMPSTKVWNLCSQ